MIDTKDLKRLLKLCPDIALTNADLKKIIEEESFNSVICSYKADMASYEVPVVEAVEEEPVEEDFLEDEDQEDTCEDGACECESPIIEE